MRRATGNHLAPILRLLLGWGADYMVCCDSGKTFVRDLLWRDWQAEDEGLYDHKTTCCVTALTLLLMQEDVFY